MKNYLLTLLQTCSEEEFGQEAIEWAIGVRIVLLVGNVDADARAIMLRYDEIITKYRQSLLPIAA